VVIDSRLHAHVRSARMPRVRRGDWRRSPRCDCGRKAGCHRDARVRGVRPRVGSPARIGTAIVTAQAATRRQEGRVLAFQTSRVAPGGGEAVDRCICLTPFEHRLNGHRHTLVLPMPNSPCPTCGKAGRFLGDSSEIAHVDYYRCDSCREVWVLDSSDPDGPPRLVTQPKGPNLD